MSLAPREEPQAAPRTLDADPAEVGPIPRHAGDSTVDPWDELEWEVQRERAKLEVVERDLTTVQANK